MTKSKLILSYVLMLVWMAIIFHLSSQVSVESSKLSQGVTEMVAKAVQKITPSLDMDILHHLIRKMAHFSAYLVLGVLVSNAINQNDKFSIKVAFMLCLLYASSDEIHQSFVPGRGPAIKDVMIDSAGAFVGINIFKIVYWKFRDRNS